MKTKHKYPYRWTLKNTTFTEDKGTVFSCFTGGGGSSMGYKLAGFNVLGCNEIDAKMMEAYKINLKPKYAYLEPIQTFKNRSDLPDDLYNLDILDGSPPCSSFSMAGNREKDWNKKKKFREGQSYQVLDTLFFDFIDLAKKLQPKVVVAENVKGLLLGNAKSYVIEIYRQLELAGYYIQHWLLNASKMGVPQRRERVFFIALRKDLAASFLYEKDLYVTTPKLKLEFNEPPIYFKEFYVKGLNDRPVSKGKMYEYWLNKKEGDRSFKDVSKRIYNKEKAFNSKFLYLNKIPFTYTANNSTMFLFDEYRNPNKIESCCIGSFPQDYDFMNNQYYYVIGMSVPPVMIAHISFWDFA